MRDITEHGEPTAAVGLAEANPRSVEEAVRWQLDRIGSTAWQGWALRFQRLAFGYAAEAGWRTSEQAHRWLEEHGLCSVGVPDRGELAWFRVNDIVTVRCGLGDGTVIGPGVQQPGLRAVGIGIVDHRNLGHYVGRSPAVFPFAR